MIDENIHSPHRPGMRSLAGGVLMRLRVLIADDEPLARERLRRLLLDEPGVEIVGECASGTEAVQGIQETTPDLVMMDVRMPELDGFEVLHGLDQECKPAVVFVTAHDTYAVRAFEAHAADYLLKPFTRARLQETLRRVRAFVSRGGSPRHDPDPSALSAIVKATFRPPVRFPVRAGGRISLVKAEEIDWIRSADNYAELHVGSAVHLVRETMLALERRLPAHQFVRISRSLMVQVSSVGEIRPKSHGDYLVVMRDGSKLPGSRKYRAQLLKLLGGTG